MPPRTTIHSCSECGFQSGQWHGQCPGCEAWNTLVEERVQATRGEGRTSARPRRRSGGSGAGANGRGARPRLVPLPLAEVSLSPVKRLSTGIGELDRVLGGGLVPGSLV